jgi:peptidoglycan hydrolase-like protein with peptidoglycan-binding domain
MEYYYNFGEKTQKSDEIRRFQERLNKIRTALHGNWDYLEPNGVFDQNTYRAVQQFQMFAGIMKTGNLDMATQTAIDVQYHISLTVNFNSASVIGQYVHGSNPAADRSIVRPPYAATGTLTYTATSFPDSYDIPSEKTFFERVKDMWNGIAADLDAIIGGLKYTPLKNAGPYIVEKVKVLLPKFTQFCKKVAEMFSKLKNAVAETGKSIVNGIKGYGAKIMKGFEANPAGQVEKLSKFAKAKGVIKGFAKRNAVGIVLAGIPMVYHLVKWIIASQADKEKCKKEFFDSFKAFIGALIVMILIELGAAIVVAGAALAGVSLSFTAVAAVIGLCVAVADILAMHFTNMGLGDMVMVKLGEVGDFIGDKATQFGNFVIDTTAAVGKTISDTATAVGKGISDTATAVGKSISDTFDSASQALYNTFSAPALLAAHFGW